MTGKIIRSLSLVFFVLFIPFFLQAQPREKQSLNSGWQFVLNDDPALSSVKKNNTAWQKINLPHTWNALDIVDEPLGYHQGIGWYKKELFFPEQYRDKHVELFFEGACNRATIFINGIKAGEHSGGFTGFNIDLDGKILYGKTNEILVKVDNGKYLQDSIPPWSGDFNLMGGIYRDAWLIITNKIHFSNGLNDEGLMFKTPQVSNANASFGIEASYSGSLSPFTGSIEYSLSFDGKTIKSGKKDHSSPFAGSGIIELNDNLEDPKLWSPETPNLYILLVQLKNEKGELLDEVSQHVGFKWVGISDKNEFLLNGKPYKLKGASRHQDHENLGNALPDALHVRDIELMKEMGCNFLRIAHYPQDPAIYDACDRLGIITWSEIPVVDKVVDNETFFNNSQLMMVEMIFQNYNHPSIGIWGYHNEVRNLDNVSVRHAKMLDSLAKHWDPQRLTAIAFESNIDAPYFKNPLLKSMLNIADINGYNVYQGWYRGKFENIGDFLDTLYAYNPTKPIMLSEYGAGSSTSIHTYQPTIFDFSEEYQCNFHEAYFKAGNTKPWMIGFAIWNFIDFQRDGREDVQPNINNKGMVTAGRHPKDVYYFYKSQWSSEPFVYITGKYWKDRIALTGNDKSIQIPITVYSNQKELQLVKDGKAISTISSATGKFQWMINVAAGINSIVCKTTDGKLTDVLDINYSFIDTGSFAQNTGWQQLNFNTGQTRTFFTDIKTKEQWIPDKPYSKGTWGWLGGSVWNTWASVSWNGIREGIHKPIAKTENEPLLQTFVEGLTNWKADVPSGKYRITLLLCEPFTVRERKNEQRIFSIYLNKKWWVQDINMEKDYGVQSAIILDKIIDVKNNEGINIEFIRTAGKTILNGVSIRRL